jgi:hypothetical protein
MENPMVSFSYVIAGVVVYIMIYSVIIHFYRKETREWMMGPDYFDLMEGIIFLFLPLGIYEIISARKMNHNKTAPKTIKSVWL